MLLESSPVFQFAFPTVLVYSVVFGSLMWCESVRCRKGRRYSGFRFRLLSVCLSLNTDYLSMEVTQGWPNAQGLNLGDGRGRLIGSGRENTGASAQSQFIQSTGGFSALVVVGVCTLVSF